MVPTWAISAFERDLFRVLLQLDHGLDRDIDAALEVHRIHPRCHRLGAFPDDRSGEYRRGSGAVTGNVRGLRGDLAYHFVHPYSRTPCLRASSISLATVTPSLVGDARVRRTTARDTTLRLSSGRASPSRRWREWRRRATSCRAHRPRISTSLAAIAGIYSRCVWSLILGSAHCRRRLGRTQAPDLVRLHPSRGRCAAASG